MTVPPFALFLLQDAAAPSGPLAGPHSNALVDMIHASGTTALVVLGILLIASIMSWAIIITKWRAFKEADVQGKRFIRAFRKSGRLSEIAAIADQFKPSPLVAVFHEIHDEYQRQAGGRGTPPNPQALERAAQTKAQLRATALRILHPLAAFAATGECDVKRLQNIEPPEFRLRVGDYRLRFHDYGHTLYVTAVMHRREVYR